MLRFLVVLTVAGSLFAAAFASAASLGVAGGAAQAGSDGYVICDTDGINVESWQLFDVTGNNAGKVGSVSIKDVSTDCVNNRLMGSVETYSGGKFALKPIDGSNNPTGNWVTITDNAGAVYQMGIFESLNATQISYLDMTDIKGITLYIEGPSGL